MITETQAVDFADTFEKLVDQISGDVLGKGPQIRRALLCLLAGGHLLIEDVPGVAKTSLAKSLAAAIGGDFHRVQFTPDLLPSDITGGPIYRQDTGTMELIRGPVFTNVLLADEINRAAPRTQSALLEAMAERQVTISGATHRLEPPFVCIATQNPMEMYGTYPLPEAQLDRFAVRLTLGYPDAATEARAIALRMAADDPGPATAMVSSWRITEMMKLARSVYTSPAILDYVARLAADSREERGRTIGVELGVSPRGSITLMACAAVLAVSQGKVYVSAQDVKDVAGPVLAHRLVMRDGDSHGREAAEDAVRTMLDRVDQPTGPLEPPADAAGR